MKKKGDKLAHQDFICTITTELKNVNDFLAKILEIKKYFISFKRLYQAKNRNDSFNDKINYLNDINKDIDFLSILEDFLFSLKK